MCTWIPLFILALNLCPLISIQNPLLSSKLSSNLISTKPTFELLQTFEELIKRQNKIPNNINFFFENRKHYCILKVSIKIGKQ